MVITDYSQPLDYHFSEISIQFVKRVLGYLREHCFNPLHVCDAYAGCGVVGLEFKSALTYKVNVDFIEVQKEIFEEHLQLNAKWKENIGQYYFLSLNKFNYQENKTYDLILANPPYYEANQVRLSPNKVKATAHSFIEGNLEDFFILTNKSLLKNGLSFFLFPNEFYEDRLKPLSHKFALQISHLSDLNKNTGLFLLRHLNKN
jgi:tRNA1(Val) A37 N6-methylase TrmN6